MKLSTTTILVIIMIGGLWGAGQVNKQLVTSRKEMGISQADPLINAPPLVVFTTVALGGFRGIIADLLWMRSARLQSEGKYFELVQLADWITKLEPRFTEVWAYHAWNLSYNISVLFSNKEDRWRWVRHGLTMLRDEGVLYNPGESRLLYELGWIFQHKIGGNSDDMHMFYKQSWAAEMQNLLGGGRPDYDKLLAAAKNPVELNERTGMRDLLASLEKEGIDPLNYQSLDIPKSHPAYKIIDSSPYAEAWISYIVRQKLEKAYKLDPDIMREIETTSGPLDWRLPQAHAIYWATLSKKFGKEADDVFAERMIYQSLTDAFRRGKLVTGGGDARFIMSPYLELLPYVTASYEEAIRTPSEKGTAIDGYRNFLSEAVVLLYLYNRIEEAEAIFKKLKAFNPDVSGETNLLDYVFATYTSQSKNSDEIDAYASVEAALYQSELWNLMGDSERSAGYAQLANLVWQRFMEPRQNNKEWQERTGLPPLEDIRQAAILRAQESISGNR
jgi:hypothetical protein